VSASPGPQPDTASEPARPPAKTGKPRFALFIATACGLGYIPFAPGTWGSLAGLAIAIVCLFAFVFTDVRFNGTIAITVSKGMAVDVDPLFFPQWVLAIGIAAIGVWSASRAARFWQQKDPQRVVIDEVSGQHLALLLGSVIPVWWKIGTFPPDPVALGFFSLRAVLSWKYLLLGLILFRLFDIWKPFPVRQAESLSGGWGIMADDWVAAVYAGIGLWIARAAGL